MLEAREMSWGKEDRWSRFSRSTGDGVRLKRPTTEIALGGVETWGTESVGAEVR